VFARTDVSLAHRSRLPCPKSGPVTAPVQNSAAAMNRGQEVTPVLAVDPVIAPFTMFLIQGRTQHVLNRVAEPSIATDQYLAPHAQALIPSMDILPIYYSLLLVGFCLPHLALIVHVLLRPC
jgi:hypothetical protein